MKAWNHIMFLLILLLASQSLKAQNEKRLQKQAEDAERLGDYGNALVLYLKILETKPEDAQVNYKAGVLYLDQPYKTRALPYLEKAYSLNNKVSNAIHKYLGQAYQYNHQWDKAIEQYELCKTTLDKKDPFYPRLERRIYECNNGKEFMASPVDAKIINVGSNINTIYPDFAPVISADESTLIFTSRREGSTGDLRDEEGYMEDIYISHKGPGGEWAKPENIGTNINTEGHDASVALSANGTELFTYDGTDQGDIKYCKLKKDSSWSKPFKIASLNSKAGETSVCISPDGNTLFLTSDREGGFGQLDIYQSTKKKNGDWSEPENLGPIINTPSNEDGVFLDFDGKTLYFSSQDHKGMGGYDIFKSVYDSVSNRWSEPENIGYPINTADNDTYFVLSGDGKNGYYASVREDGFGEKDIYRIVMPPRKDYQQLVDKMEKLLKKEIPQVEPVTKIEPIQPVPAEVKKEKMPVRLKGQIYDFAGHNPLPSIVQLLDSKGKVLKEIQTGSDGNYEFDVTFDQTMKLKVTAQAQKYGIATKTVEIPASSEQEQTVMADLGLGKLEVGTKIILRNIYYDFDKASLKSESLNELNKILRILQENPAMVVRIGSHTDSYGSNEYNYSLSARRAISVVKWLEYNGISEQRLKYKGYGEDQPLASNDDEEEGRELNRRTEFEILSK